jgi:ferric-dicitrate binding protein FerR (iron transport regulator)
MKNNINWDLMIMYLEGSCSEADERKILEWKEESQENRNEFELLKNLWDTQDLSLPEVDVEKSLEVVKQRIRIYSDSNETQKSKIFKIHHKKKLSQFFNSFTTPVLLKTAAVILILFSGIYFFSKLFQNNLMKEVIVKNKELKEITLSDGTVIELDAGSSLKYPDQFGDDKREVFLSGEAYFNVTSKQKTPFIVQTGKAEITVLGTKFNVRAWEETRKVAVVVVDGIVSLSSQNADNNRGEVTISVGKMSVLDENGFVSDPVEIDTEQHLAWMNREYYFQSATLSEVLDQLNRWYDIDFSLPADSYASNRITVYLRNQPIEDNLELISLIMNFHYLINGNRVTFKLNE